MADGKSLKVIVVTPERAVLDTHVDMVILPLYDGELGVQPGHSAFVGQLGPGEMRLNIGGTVTRYFIDGGFAQVRANTVNVLTPSAKKAEDISDATITAERTRADALPEANAIEKASKARAKAKVAGMARVAKR